MATIRECFCLCHVDCYEKKEKEYVCYFADAECSRCFKRIRLASEIILRENFRIKKIEIE